MAGVSAELGLRWNPALPGADGMAQLVSESDSVLLSWRICITGASSVRATVSGGYMWAQQDPWIFLSHCP